MVLLTVRSLASCFRTLSYSAMAFCSLPCWTNFSAALRTFCLLKPKPNAIGVRTPAFTPPNARDFRQRCRTGRTSPGIPRRDTANRAGGSRSKVIVRPGTRVPMVTDDYRGLPKGRVRPGYGKNPLPPARMGARNGSQDAPCSPQWCILLPLYSRFAMGNALALTEKDLAPARQSRSYSRSL